MNLWINDCNPEVTSFLMDPWCFEIPLALKPTFLNMNLPFEEINAAEFVQDGKLNFANLIDCLSEHIDWNRLSKMRFEADRSNHWVWIHNSSSAKLSNAIYHFYNQTNPSGMSLWIG